MFVGLREDSPRDSVTCFVTKENVKGVMTSYREPTRKSIEMQQARGQCFPRTKLQQPRTGPSCQTLVQSLTFDLLF